MFRTVPVSVSGPVKSKPLTPYHARRQIGRTGHRTRNGHQCRRPSRRTDLSRWPHDGDHAWSGCEREGTAERDKSPCQLCALRVVKTTGADASNVVPAAISNAPPVPVVLPLPPSAVALPTLKRPAASVVVPRYAVLAPLKVSAPVALLCVIVLTLTPIGTLITVVPDPLPVCVSVPVKFTVPPVHQQARRQRFHRSSA